MRWIWVAKEVKTEDRIDFNGKVSVELWRGGENRVAQGILIRVQQDARGVYT
jgi:hypothetical protein